MIVARAGSGWQTVMADLCLILFMVTAASLAAQRGLSASPSRPQPAPRAEPLAIYRAGPGAPPLGEWLEAQAPDPRQQLTLVAHYRPGGEGEAMALAARLLAQAGPAAARARVVVEPGEPGATAMLAYDDPVLARALQTPAAGPTAPEPAP
ncbi:MAG TPA: hypothetical protein PKE25_02460 [Novosphingobium sp.]|nr:hypothetical protein [Novosphingobium sp.]